MTAPTGIETELRAVLHRRAELATFAPRAFESIHDDWPHEPRRSRPLAVIAAAVVLTAGAVGVWLLIAERETDRAPLATAPPATPPLATDASASGAVSTAAPTASTTITATTTIATAVTPEGVTAESLARLLGLPSPWTVSAIDVIEMPLSGASQTVQRWGVLAADGVSFDRVVEIVIHHTPGQPDQAAQWEPNPMTTSVNGSWRSNGVSYLAVADGLTVDDAAQFADALELRNPNDAFAGLDGATAALPLVEEYIGTGQPGAAEKWLTIRLDGPGERTAELLIYNREGPAMGLGAPTRRVRIDGHIAVLSPPEFFGLIAEWADNGIHYRVSVEDRLEEIVDLGNALSRVGTDQWRTILDHAQPRPPTSDAGQYTVQIGDSVAAIADKFDITMDSLVAYNNWAEGISHPLTVGETVLIPPGASPVPPCTCTTG
jgi:hypothetical protein